MGAVLAVDLPGWVDVDFLRTGSTSVVAAAVVLGLLAVVRVKKPFHRIVSVTVLATLVIVGLRYREELEDCVRTCDCSFLGQEVRADGCDRIVGRADG